MTDTIFALSSGAVPAAIGIIRISGPSAGEALRRLAGRLPPQRRASLADLRDVAGEMLDRALVLWLPGPATATGEDMAELHCHGGRAVVAAVSAALMAMPGLRVAQAGEFTRRAFVHGRIDLAEAEGLADLLSAETELQRRNALALAGGGLSRTVEAWRARVLTASAQVEAVLDFADDDDVAGLPADFGVGLRALQTELAGWLDRPHAEMLRDGVRVVIAGPPNAGKSTLFNRLVESEAAITAPTAGTTRDVLTRLVAIGGIAFVFSDTAGLREDASDLVETEGIARARNASAQADIVLWLGAEGAGPAASWEIAAQIDRRGHDDKGSARHRVSALSGEGLAGLREDLVTTARQTLPRPGELAVGEHQRRLIGEALAAIAGTGSTRDPLLIAEHLRLARAAFDRLVGRTGTEDVLDAVFRRFCIGK